MPIEDMLPSYRASLQYVTDRIERLHAERRDAERARRWHDADVIHDRIIALDDTAAYLVDVIREIERHGKQ